MTLLTGDSNNNPVMLTNNANQAHDDGGLIVLDKLTSKGFSWKRDLKRHISDVHLKLKPFTCDKCGKSFAQKSKLKAHISSFHEGNRPYKCETCNIAFSLKKDLNRHISGVHMNIRPFKCDVCQKSFGRKIHLERHTSSIHLNRRPFKCELCGFAGVNTLTRLIWNGVSVIFFNDVESNERFKVMDGKGNTQISNNFGHTATMVNDKGEKSVFYLSSHSQSEKMMDKENLTDESVKFEKNPIQEPKTLKKEELKIWKFHPIVILISATIIESISSCMFSAYGILMLAIVDATGERTGYISWFGGIAGFSMGVSSVLVGTLIEVLGCRVVIAIGALIFVAGHVFCAFTSNTLMLIIVLGLSQGLGTSCLYITPYVIVAQWFDRKRSVALSVVSFGMGFGMLAWSPIAAFFIDMYFWRGALLIIAGIFLNGMVLGLLLIQPPSTKPKKMLDAKQGFIKLFDRRLLRNKEFIFVMFAFLFVFFGHNSIYAFLPKRTADFGTSRVQASLTITFANIVSCICRLLIGFLTELKYFDKMVMFILSIFVAGVSTIMTIFVENFIGISLYAAGFGCATGVYIAMNIPVLIKLCGTEFVSQTTGWNMFIAGLALTTARTISGWMYDITNDSSDNGMKIPEDKLIRVDENVKRYAYVILVLSFTLQALSGCMFSTYGVLLVNIADSTEVNTGFISWFGGIASLSLGLSSVSTGIMIDLFGSKITVFIGAIIFLLGHVVCAFVNNLYVVIIILGLSQGYGTSAFQVTSFIITTRWFTKRRSFALSFLAGGLGLGMLSWGPLAAYLADIYGWRGTLLLLGAIFSNGAFLAMLLKEPRETLKTNALSIKQTILKLFNKELTRSLLFFTYISVIGFVHFSYNVLIALLPRKIVDMGGSNLLGGLMITIVTGSSTVLRFIVGVCADKPYFNTLFIYLTSVLVAGISSICTMFIPNVFGFIVFAVIFGSSSGIFIALNIPLPIQIFGVKWVSHVTSWNILVIGLFSSVSRTLSGRIYDLTNNATICFVFSGFVQIVAAVLILIVIILIRKKKNMNNVINDRPLE
ncbi:DgyrCDS612 [Dimorphilus gyrociliatus]|uniref:DgyrCDS612 n=1 Tax=Dimorphilus gyrociliatus TaxID=2664684 RepID=A0A7I8V7Y2_9ANNE|nr:DgyrCDS612 [Dimorphilus gyrociliatus]